MFKWLQKWKANRSQATRPEPVFHAHSDMTTDDQIRKVVRWGEHALEEGHKVLVLDLSDAVSIDSGLIAGIILLSRRARPMRATLKLIGYSAQFESLMKFYRVWAPLAQSGVILQPKEYAEPQGPAPAATSAMPTRPHASESTASGGAKSNRIQPNPAV